MHVVGRTCDWQYISPLTRINEGKYRYLLEVSSRETEVMARLREATAPRPEAESLIAVDNTLGLSRTPVIRMTSENAQAIKEFNRRVHRDPRVEIAMLPVGEGLTLA